MTESKTEQKEKQKDITQWQTERSNIIKDIKKRNDSENQMWYWHATMQRKGEWIDLRGKLRKTLCTVVMITNVFLDSKIIVFY